MALDPLSRPQSVFALQKELAARASAATPSCRWPRRCAAARQPGHRHKKTPEAGHARREPAQMKFSVFQLSRRGGREKNEDRMGYCYTRESACSCWPTAWAATPRARWLRRSRCRPFRDVPAPGQAALKMCRVPVGGAAGGAPPDPALRQRQGHDGHAAHHAGGGRGAGRRPLDALRRLAPVPGARRRAAARTRDHSYRSCATPPRPGARQPQRAVHLPGLAHQAHVRRGRPGAAGAGRPPAAVLRRPVGHAGRRHHRRGAGRRPSRRPCPAWSRSAAQGRRSSDNVTVLAMEWERRRVCHPPGRLHRQHQRRGVRLHHPGRLARGRGRATTGRREAIERSIAEINDAIPHGGAQP
jgi:hypothetical protein